MLAAQSPLSPSHMGSTLQTGVISSYTLAALRHSCLQIVSKLVLPGNPIPVRTGRGHRHMASMPARAVHRVAVINFNPALHSSRKLRRDHVAWLAGPASMVWSNMLAVYEELTPYVDIKFWRSSAP